MNWRRGKGENDEEKGRKGKENKENVKAKLNAK
jgi:hypothetical protein